jgi:hypothetical protein
VGYDPGELGGTYSPTGLTGGETVAAILDNGGTNCFPESIQFSVSGFTSNPGATWLTSITCNGIEETGSTASFSYLSGSAWVWNDVSFGFGLDTVSCSIVYK